MAHIFKRTVALLNDFDNIDLVLKKAIDFSTKHHTSLEVLYVQEEGLFEVPDYFLSEDKIAKERIDKSKIKAKIEEHLHVLKQEEKHAILVYVDDTVDRVLNYLKEHKDILLISFYHESLSEDLIKNTPYSYWILKNNLESYNNIAIPLDFTDESKRVIQATKHIFEESHITIAHNYRYMMDTISVQVDYLDTSPMLTPDILEINKEMQKVQKETFERYKKEFNVDGVCIEEEGSLDSDLRQYLSHQEFDLIVLYHHDTELFLSPSLISLLLKELQTDFFIFNL